ncbi:hypothetical protein B0T18DRAFT_395667 [Schizothecium vesticola]|uniref:AAA+ ATPase domain-containing protein n=1 Tax=Schizothecium vesticola TaxID=314040 RepID=A0AA40KBE0_9PEZI|nr:hypothetical protein B0T18DRAFT_395667 [Schizothecium vesticola]
MSEQGSPTILPRGGASSQGDAIENQAGDHGDGQIKSSPETAEAAGDSPVTTPLLLEIRALQQRLLQLESVAANDKVPTGGNSTAIEAAQGTGRRDQEDKRLRKEIRRARWAKKATEIAEQRAEKSRFQRKDHAYEGHPLSHEENHEQADGTAEPYKVAKVEGNAPNDFATVREEQTWAEWNTSDDQATFNRPKRALRPLTALRPVYSRKLGPPTQWDMSDSDEWSDGSTRSRDFDYFRARLRGDFEWELDRLHAQRERYLKHKERKKEEARNKAEAELIGSTSKKPGEDRTAAVETTPTPVTPAAIQDTEEAAARLHQVGWDEFVRSREAKESSSFAIDVLVGEPQITLSNSKQKKRSGRVNPKGMQENNPPPATVDGQGPLPERIRINSSHLIMILCRIHGSVLPSSEGAKKPSLVLLRPFRILVHYEKEIRDWFSRLASIHAEGKSTAEGGNAVGSVAPNLPESTANTKEDGNDTKGEKKPEVEDPMGISTSPTALAHLRCLLEFYDTYLSRKKDYLSSPVCDKILFSDLWHLYKPGDFVISSDGKQAYRIVSVRLPRHKGSNLQEQLYQYLLGLDQETSIGDKSKVLIVCVSINFDGKMLGPVTTTIKIPRFDGERPIGSFRIYPLRHYALKVLQELTTKTKKDVHAVEAEESINAGVAELKRQLLARGRMFVEVAAVKHMYYAGLTVDTRDEVESQVVIDFGEAFTSATERQRKKWLPEIEALTAASGPNTQGDSGQIDCSADCCRLENVHSDGYVDVNRFNKFRDDFMTEIEDSPHKLPSVTAYPRSLEDTKPGVNALREEELLIMSYCAFGYILRDRTWAQLDLTYLEPVDKGAFGDESTTINDNGTSGSDSDGPDSDDDVNDNSTFGRLVLPTGHKKMILSLIAQHFRSKGSQDEQADIVRGKGKGLIILLHGAPGVGKTTTAEGVAERFKKPLFQITCGDLGSDARQVESALQTNFALANRWGCILLLDEADVFLASRRREDFTRNGLVAVFLRVLEYYAGILFLTTNRIGDFDEAFASRIHMSLHYPALDKISTTKVFKLNLGIIRARYDIKGRKIKIEEDEILEDVSEYFRLNEQARWNGRQIRNACQTALALAEFDAQPRGKKYDIKAKSTARVHLRATHLKIVSKAYLDFMQYLREVHGTDAETYAKESGTRALETVIHAIKAGKGMSGKEENLLSKFKLKSTKGEQSAKEEE